MVPAVLRTPGNLHLVENFNKSEPQTELRSMRTFRSHQQEKPIDQSRELEYNMEEI